MRAVLYDGAGASLVDLEPPTPGPGEVVLDVAAAGLCHSDLTLMGRDASAHPFSLPLVLGHEIAGAPVAYGDGVEPLTGTTYAVYGPWGCGRCARCRAGAENLCPFARGAGVLPPGLGSPGGLADRVVVPARHLVDASGIDPVQVAPLTDAGTTAVAAVRAAGPLSAGDVAVVIGAGGLGHLALQALTAWSEASLVVLDRSPAARSLATELGALAVVGEDELVSAVGDLSGGTGAAAVLDFVAVRSTLAVGREVLAAGGHLGVVGVSTDTLEVSIPSMPLGSRVVLTYWGTRQDLDAALRLSREGGLTVHSETVALEDVPMAYERLAAGEVSGRLVALPGASR